MKWHTMDEEPLMIGVILYSKKHNAIYDASYVGGGKFNVGKLTVDKSQFDLWYQRSDFFRDSGLGVAIDKQLRKKWRTSNESK